VGRTSSLSENLTAAAAAGTITCALYIQSLSNQLMKLSTTTLTVEYALLGFVYEQPSHGYEIYQLLSAPDGLWQVWRMKQSQLYALLTKLEDEGYLVTTLQPQEARPPRKVYSLTAAGSATFEQWLTSPVTHGRQMRLEFLAKLYFAYRQGSGVVLPLLEGQIATCRQWLVELQEQSPESSARHSFAFAVQQFRVSQIDSFLAWLAICHQALLAAIREGQTG
jgi:PadR family transcriptional regulator, regulatory protein AphA